MILNKKRHGFTIVEVLTSIVVVLLVLSMIHTSMAFMLHREYGSSEAARVNRGINSLVSSVSYSIRSGELFLSRDIGPLSGVSPDLEGEPLLLPQSWVMADADGNVIPRLESEVAGNAVIFCCPVDELATETTWERPDSLNNNLEDDTDADGFPDGNYDLWIIHGEPVGAYDGVEGARELVLRRYPNVEPATRFAPNTIDFQGLFAGDDFQVKRTGLFFDPDELSCYYLYQDGSSLASEPSGVRIVGQLLAVRNSEGRRDKMRIDLSLMSRNI